MANYEKQVEQEAAYPIPISLYNCYRTVRHEKRGIATPDSVSHASLSCNNCTKIRHNAISMKLRLCLLTHYSV